MNNDDKKEKTELKSPEDVLEFILNEGIIEVAPYKTERRGNSLYIPKFDLLLTPSIQQITNTGIGIEFNMYMEKLDKYLYEYSSGMGQDINTAVGVSISSFLFSFINTFEFMHNKDNPRNLTTEFGGKEHNWDVYLGNVIGLGSPDKAENTASATQYWDLLKDDIIKRLGNQKLVYVKIYAARFPDDTIGEVRFDDVAIPELGEKVRKLAEEWNVDMFGSDKQFILIEQNPATITPNPYDGPEGKRKMREHVVEYLKLFGKATTKELYDSLVEDCAKVTGDKTLANECFGFLPEIAAICALDGRIVVSDQIQISYPDKKTVTSYTTQLSDYAPLENCLFDIIRGGDFGEETKNLWQDLVGTSALINVYAKTQEEGSNINPKLTALLYNVSQDFELR